MKKTILFLVIVMLSLTMNGQVTKVVTRVNEAGDVASFELDCSVKFPTLAKGLKYNITRHEFKGPDLKNEYFLMLVMDGFYTTTLNKKMSISVVFTDDTKVSKNETIEDDGYFDGACTLRIKDPATRKSDVNIKEIIVHTGTKNVVYTISPQKNIEFKKNFQNIIYAK